MPSIYTAVGSNVHPLVESQLPSWYPKFAQHSIKSIVIPLPLEFLHYLQEDGVFLPDDSAAVPQLDRIDAALLIDGDYRRDDWDTTENRAAQTLPPLHPTQPLLPPPQPSPSGPLHRNLLSSSTPQSSTADHTHNQIFTSSTTNKTSSSTHNDRSSDSSSESDGDQASSHDGSAAALDWTSRFPSLRAAIDAAIARLGGAVAPKLNWSAPSDALWVSGTGTLACRNADQIVLLLKSSDRVGHDVSLLLAAPPPPSPLLPATAAGTGLGGNSTASDSSEHDIGNSSHPGSRNQITESNRYQKSPPPLVSTDSAEVVSASNATVGAGDPPRLGSSITSTAATAAPSSAAASAAASPLAPVLVLKKWQPLRPEREFRCFVRHGALIAACQRDVSQAFPALTRQEVGRVRGRLWRFWCDVVRGGMQLGDFAYDVYLPSDPPTAPPRLLDINPLTPTTSPLLFEWAELGLGPGTSGGLLPAEELVRQLVGTGAAAGGGGGSSSGGPHGGGGGVAALGDDGREMKVDDSWLHEVVGVAVLREPTRAEELEVRIVPSGAPADSDETVGANGNGLSNLLGPLRLGARAALSMPYDMLGLSDSVDRMIAVMQQQQQGQRQGGRHGARGEHRCHRRQRLEEDEESGLKEEEEEDGSSRNGKDGGSSSGGSGSSDDGGDDSDGDGGREEQEGGCKDGRDGGKEAGGRQEGGRATGRDAMAGRSGCLGWYDEAGGTGPSEEELAAVFGRVGGVGVGGGEGGEDWAAGEVAMDLAGMVEGPGLGRGMGTGDDLLE